MSFGRSRATAAVLALVLPAVMVAVARGWIGTRPARWSTYSLDRFYLYGPFQEHLGRRLAQGRIPGWNPFLGLGINDASDVSLGPLYPPNALFAVLPAAWADELLAAAHIAVAASAVFLLARRGALGPGGAMVGAAVVAAGTLFNGLANFASLLMTFCWCPVAFLAARRLADQPGARATLLLAGVLAMQILAGYLQVHLYTVLCLPLFFLPLDRPFALVRPLVLAAVAELTALGLAAATWVPGLAAIAVSIRSREATPELLHHIFPVYLRHYLQGLASPWVQRSPVYGGPLLVPLVLAGVMARGIAPRLRIPAVLLTVIAVFLSLGDATPVFPLLRRLPIGHWFTGPYKWTYFAGFAAALVAAVGAHALLVPGALHRMVARVWLGLSVAYLFWVPAPMAIRAASVATVCGLVIGQRYPAPRVRGLLAIALAPMVAVTALAGYRSRPTTPADDPDFFGRYRPAYAYLAPRQEDGRTIVLVSPLRISPRQGELEGVAQFNTNGVIVTMRLARYWGAVTAGANGPERGRAIALLRSLGARFIMTEHDDYSWLGRAGLERVFTSPAADVWRDASALPRAYLAQTVEHVPGERVLERLRDLAVPESQTAVLEVEEGTTGEATTGTVRIVRSSDDEVVLSVDAAGPGVVVLLDAWSPDWRARVDGTPVPIRHANWLARAVEVPAGRHEVVFSFVPVVLYAGLVVSGLTVLGCIAVALLGRSPGTAR